MPQQELEIKVSFIQSSQQSSIPNVSFSSSLPFFSCKSKFLTPTYFTDIAKINKEVILYGSFKDQSIKDTSFLFVKKYHFPLGADEFPP